MGPADFMPGKSDIAPLPDVGLWQDQSLNLCVVTLMLLTWINQWHLKAHR